jgi:hypothetical protein
VTFKMPDGFTAPHETVLGEPLRALRTFAVREPGEIAAARSRVEAQSHQRRVSEAFVRLLGATEAASRSMGDLLDLYASPDTAYRELRDRYRGTSTPAPSVRVEDLLGEVDSDHGIPLDFALYPVTNIGGSDPWLPGENVAVCRWHEAEWSALQRSVAASLRSFADRVYIKPGGELVYLPDDSPELPPKPEPRPEGHTLAECTCGFYAYFDRADAANYIQNPILSSSRRTYGVVEAYGECVVGTKGVRARRMRIAGLVLPESHNSRPFGHREQLVERYPETLVVRTLNELLERLPTTPADSSLRAPADSEEDQWPAA